MHNIVKVQEEKCRGARRKYPYVIVLFVYFRISKKLKKTKQFFVLKLENYKFEFLNNIICRFINLKISRYRNNW